MCGSGDCGNGYQNPNIFFAAFDNVWPSGNYLGPVNGANAFTNLDSYSTPVYVYEADTTFGIMKLVTGGPAGCTIDNEYDLQPGIQIQYVSITQQPDTACIGDTMVVYAQSYGGFNNYGGWSSVAGITIVSSSPDSAVIIITSTDATELYYGGSNGPYCPVTGQIYLAYTECHALPVAAFVADDTSLCINGTNCINFIDLSSNKPTAWEWHFPGGISSVSHNQNPYSCYHTTGSFPVTLIATDGAGTDTTTISNYITVYPLPIITVTPDTSVCIGSSLQLMATGGISYDWTPLYGLNNEYISNPVVSTDIYTTYYTVYVRDTNGCVATGNVTIKINPLPVVHISRDTSLCIVSSAQLSASGGINYLWKPSAGLNDSAIANPIATLYSTTNYLVNVTDGNGCKDSATSTLTVYPLTPTPVLTLNALQDTLFCSYDSSYMAYQWYADSLAITGETNPYLVISKGGNYNVQVTDGNGCQVAVGINILILGIQNYMSDHFISLSPNPAGDKFTVYSLQFTVTRVNIYNIL